jgi:TP901 family phage tail tape measure protein
MPDYRIRIVADPSGIRPGTNAVERRLRRTEAHANRLRTTLGRLFALAGGGLVITRTIATYAKFEQRIASVAAVSRATAGELTLLIEETRRLGASTRFTATQAAEGAELLARAGFDANQVLATLDGTLRLAQAGELALARAASITTTILKGFQLEVSQTGHVVDVLAKAAASANTTVAGIGEAAKFVSPIAKSLSIDLETTTSAIMVLSNAGLQGSLAGTGLRRVLGELINPGKQLRIALAAAGKTVEDINPRFNKLTDILRTLRESGIGGEAALAIFKQRGGPAFTVLQGFIPQIEKFTKELRNSTGFAKEMARVMDDNVNGALLAVKSAFEAVVLSIGDIADTNLEGFLRGLATGMRALSRDVILFANALEFLALVLVVKVARAGIGAVLKALLALKIALLTNPITLIATILATATIALVAFSDQIFISNDGIVSLQDVFVAAFEVIKQGFREVGIFASAFFIGLRAIVKKVFGKDIGGDFTEFAVNFAKTFDTMIGVVIGFVTGIGRLFETNAFRKIGLSLQLIFKSTAFQIQITFKKLGLFLQNLFQDPIKTIAQQFKRLIGAFAGIAAVLRSLGLIKEKTRVAIDDAVTGIELLIKGTGGKSAAVKKAEEDIAALETARDAYIIETKAAIIAGSSETLNDLAAILRKANTEGLEFSFFENKVREILKRARDIGEAREKERVKKEKERNAAAAKEARKAQGKTVGEAAKTLSDDAKALLVQIDLVAQLAQEHKNLQEIYDFETKQINEQTEAWARLEDRAAIASSEELEAQRETAWVLLLDAMDLYDQRIQAVTESMIQLRLKSLDASTAIGDGFTRAFIRLAQEAEDFASIAEASVNVFVDRSADALASFVRNGQLAFKDFANAILDDLARIFARLLIIQALNVATGGAASLAGAGVAAGSAAAGRASGGSVHPGREYIVGERGPERVRFGAEGRVEPANGETGNVTVVNVEDPNEIPNAMNSPAGDRVVLNIIQRNRKTIRRAIG